MSLASTLGPSVGTKAVPLSFLPAVKITWLVSNLSTMLQLRSSMTGGGGVEGVLWASSADRDSMKSERFIDVFLLYMHRIIKMKNVLNLLILPNIRCATFQERFCYILQTASLSTWWVFDSVLFCSICPDFSWFSVCVCVRASVCFLCFLLFLILSASVLSCVRWLRAESLFLSDTQREVVCIFVHFLSLLF